MSCENAIALGKMFAADDVTNLLAHSILKIENQIFTILKEKGKGRHYRIVTYINDRVSFSTCIFSKNCCCIYLTHIDLKEFSQLQELRIRLAHELGHIAINMPDIDDPEKMNRHHQSCDINEEANAWAFAYGLIFEKSEYHRSNPNSKLIFSSKSIANSIQGIINRDNKLKSKDEILRKVKNLGVPLQI